MYYLTIRECKPDTKTVYSFADVTLSDSLVERMPVNGTRRPFPQHFVARHHRILMTADRTFGFTMDNVGANTCAIALEEISHLTDVPMQDIEVRFDGLGEYPHAILTLARKIRATQVQLDKRPDLKGVTPIAPIRSSHITL